MQAVRRGVPRGARWAATAFGQGGTRQSLIASSKAHPQRRELSLCRTVQLRSSVTSLKQSTRPNSFIVSASSDSPGRPHQQTRHISNLTSFWTRPSRPSTFNSLSTQHRHNSSQQPPPQPTPPKQTPSPPSNNRPPTILPSLPSLTPHENIYTLPNILTFSRLLSAPAIGYLLLHTQPVLALSLFIYAAFTDLIDGHLARRYNAETVVGTVIDPMADKTLMTICVACLGLTGQFPWWLVTIILCRDVLLAISAIYFRYISLPPPKTFTRYWDFSLPSAEVRPTEISKINTMLQLLLVGNAMVLPVLPAWWVEAGNLKGVLEGWEVLVAGTTVLSGLSYVGNKDAVKILTQEEGERKMEAKTEEKGEKEERK